MASSKQIETALLTEHLRYTPLTLLDDIINTVNEVTNKAVDAAEDSLLRAGPTNLGFPATNKTSRETQIDGDGFYPEARAEIDEGVHKLETLLEANIDKNFDKLEIYVLRNVLTAPAELVPWIRLGHYDNISLPTANAPSSSPSPESLQLLRRKLQETRKLHKALEGNVARNNALIAQLRSLTVPQLTQANGEQTKSGIAGTLAFLTHGAAAVELGMAHASRSDPSDTGAGPLETNTSFALSQLPALHELLAELRPKLSALEASSTTPAPESDIARERRLYVETQSRKASERQGMAAGDSAGDSSGRAVVPEELAALEDLVDSLKPNDEDRMEE